MTSTDPTSHPAEQALTQRIDELAGKLGDLLTRELRALIADHNPVFSHCGGCGAPYPCPPIHTAARLLRVEPLGRAAETAARVAVDARTAGAPILTVLRRPELDRIEHSNWNPPRFPPVEVFGFELVYPYGVCRLLISGDGPDLFTDLTERPPKPDLFLNGWFYDRTGFWRRTLEWVCHRAGSRPTPAPATEGS